MKLNFSLIIPLFNEELSAHNTLDLLTKQTLVADEVIFINSNSTDNTSEIIKNFIINNNITNWYLHDTDLETPSEAKNYGIQISRHNWCAFMDFDLIFSKKWLELQVSKISENKKVLISYGTLDLKPKSYFDKVIIAQTYGLNSSKPAIPSSFINKMYFEEYGYFLPYRSFYDKSFINKSLKKVSEKIIINSEIKINYKDINYAKNFYELFLKTLNYTLQSVYIKNNLVPYVYILIFLIFLFLIYINKLFIFYILILLFLIRGILIPYKKNKNFFKEFNLSDLPLIFFVGCFIDFVKTTGFILGFILRVFNKKIRLDRLYKKTKKSF